MLAIWCYFEAQLQKAFKLAQGHFSPEKLAHKLNISINFQMLAAFCISALKCVLWGVPLLIQCIQFWNRVCFVPPSHSSIALRWSFPHNSLQITLMVHPFHFVCKVLRLIFSNHVFQSICPRHGWTLSTPWCAEYWCCSFPHHDVQSIENLNSKWLYSVNSIHTKMCKVLMSLPLHGLQEYWVWCANYHLSISKCAKYLSTSWCANYHLSTSWWARVHTAGSPSLLSSIRLSPTPTNATCSSTIYIIQLFMIYINNLTQ